MFTIKEAIIRSNVNGATPIDKSLSTWESHHLYIYPTREKWTDGTKVYRVRSSSELHDKRYWCVADFKIKNYLPYER